MSVSISSGSIKYVFTQAVAPSSEGEVEGSLWYDTVNTKLYTYTGASWEKVADEPDTWEVIDEGYLTSDGDITITNIDSEYRFLRLVMTVRANGSDALCRLVFNDDSGANYDHNRWYGTGTSIIEAVDIGDNILDLFEADSVRATVVDVLIDNPSTASKSIKCFCACPSHEFNMMGGIYATNTKINKIVVNLASGSLLATSAWKLIGMKVNN